MAVREHLRAGKMHPGYAGGPQASRALHADISEFAVRLHGMLNLPGTIDWQLANVATGTVMLDTDRCELPQSAPCTRSSSASRVLAPGGAGVQLCGSAGHSSLAMVPGDPGCIAGLCLTNS